MKAVRINEWGTPVQIEDIAQPMPNSDEVLVRVHAASLNGVDVAVVAGYLQGMISVPMTIGTDFAGEVAAVGADITHVKAGDHVYGMIPIRGGAFAEYSVAKANEVALKPQSLDDVQASAVPLTGLSAWQALFNLAQLQAGEWLLIHGAGGAVGGYAVQLAKEHGAYVIASDIPEKKAHILALGADEFIDAKLQRFEDVAKDIDVV
ncbi:MAG: NADP-dependent oxidoreductase, partial [Burkholderiales bacterium]|nr:NADP-dependent oxidoreductase [Anaerolineae bacterium]